MLAKAKKNTDLNYWSRQQEAEVGREAPGGEAKCDNSIPVALGQNESGEHIHREVAPGVTGEGEVTCLNHWARYEEAELRGQDLVAADEQHRGTRHQDVRAQHEGQSNQDHCTGDHWMAADICSGTSGCKGSA